MKNRKQVHMCRHGYRRNTMTLLKNSAYWGFCEAVDNAHYFHPVRIKIIGVEL